MIGIGYGRFPRAGHTVVALALALAACGPPRSLDGHANNPKNIEMGAAETALRRMAPAEYADGMGAMIEAERPNPRAVSNLVCAQERSIPDTGGASAFVWQWGQFLDHDIDLSPARDPLEPAHVPVPAGDPWFDPDGDGDQSIAFHRSRYMAGTGDDPSRPREQRNDISTWIDASNVYGSRLDRALALRSLDGSGQLRTSEGDLLPYNLEGLPNAGGPDPTLFLAGDVRANEQVGLTALHTLFVREHNLWAKRIRHSLGGLTGDEIYEAARAIVGAEMQVITYREFLPALLGKRALPRYRGYRPGRDARIANLFSTAAYRFGHSMLTPRLLRLDARGNSIPEGSLALREAFFAPYRIEEEGGIEPLLRGLAAQRAQAVDSFLVDDVRNFLFGPPGSGGFDLAALNIQRGRDHGLPSYNRAREAMGLDPALRFADISSDPEVQRRLARAYEGPDQLDVWIGGLAEDAYPGARVGELFYHVLRDQFLRLRDGDRYFWRLHFRGIARRYLGATRLADIIRRNTEIGRELPHDVFTAADPVPESDAE